MLGQAPIFSRPAIIVGAGDEGHRIAQRIARRPDTGIYVLGFADPNPEEVSAFLNRGDSSLVMLGSTKSISSIVSSYTD